MELLADIFTSIINPLLIWIAADDTGPAIAGIIAISALLIILISLAYTIREALLMKATLTTIACDNETEFAKQFNIIDQDLSEIDRIRIAWAEFKETLIQPKFDEEGMLISPCENTIRPQEFFNTEELGIGPNFAKVWPSIFVGIGLSLTFLGLIAALSEAVVVVGQSGNDAANIQAAITDLLQISQAKFYASLFALFSSIVMTLSLRKMSSYLEALMSQVAQKLEACVRHLGSERIALDANVILREQLAQLQTFNTDLAMKIGEQVQSSLSASLAPVVEKLDNMSGDMAQQNINAIKDIAQEVTQGIQGATSGAMDRVADTLDSISEKLGGLSENLGNALSNFDSDFTEMLNTLTQSLKASTEDISEGINKSMQNMNEGVSETATEVSAIFDGFKHSVQGLAEIGSEITSESADELRRQVEAASQQASENIAEAGRSIAEGFQESTGELVTRMSMLNNQFKQLESLLNNLPEKISVVNSELGASAKEISAASTEFSSATSGIKEIVGPLAQYASETSTTIKSVTETMQTVSSQVGESASEINSAVTKLAGEVSSQVERLDGADAQLAKLLIGIEESTEKVLGEVNRFVSEVDNGFASSIGILNESISDFEDSIDSLGKLIKSS